MSEAPYLLPEGNLGLKRNENNSLILKNGHLDKN